VTRKEGNDVVTTVTKATEHIPGDVGAQGRWLNNRKPRQWRDRLDVTVDPDENKTSAELDAELLQFLIDNGVKINLPKTIEGEAVTNRAAPIGAKTAGRHGGNRGVVERARRFTGGAPTCFYTNRLSLRK
jgi:hypothetical protein